MSLPLSDRSVEAVVACLVIKHIADLDGVLTEVDAGADVRADGSCCS